MKNKLYILCGIPFAGKTTLAKKIEEELNFIRIDLDDIKFNIFGKDITDSQIDQLGWNKIYEEMYKKIKQNLTEGKTVVHDTGNFTKHERQLVRKIADEVGVEAITIFVDTPAAEAYKRLVENRKTKKRFDVDDTDFRNTIKEMEPPTIDEKHLVFGWTDTTDEWIKNNLT